MISVTFTVKFSSVLGFSSQNLSGLNIDKAILIILVPLNNSRLLSKKQLRELYIALGDFFF